MRVLTDVTGAKHEVPICGELCRHGGLSPARKYSRVDLGWVVTLVVIAAFAAGVTMWLRPLAHVVLAGDHAKLRNALAGLPGVSFLS